MNKKLENYKEQFVKKFGLDVYKDYVSDEDNTTFTQIFNKGKKDEIAEKLKGYKKTTDTMGNYYFYKPEPVEFTKEELDEYINMKMLDYSKSIDKNINIIKNIIIIVSLIGIIGGIVMFNR